MTAQLPDAPAPIDLAQAHLRAGNAAAAVAVLEHATRLAPRDAALWTALGVALRFCGRIADAGTAFVQALACDSTRADAATGLGMIRLAQGRQTEGWALYQARWRHTGWTERLRHPEPTLWGGRLSPGLRLLLWCEQGFGDAIQFSRYAPWLAQQLEAVGGRLVFEVPAPLLRLFQASWPMLDIVPAGGRPPPFDVHLPLMDLPSRFGLQVGEGGLPASPLPFPYLKAQPAPSASPSENRPLRVGLCWQGRPTHPDDRLRSIPAEQLDALAELPGVAWVALQQDGHASPRRPWMQQGLEGLADFADSAAVIGGLNAVLAVDTAVAHLAGALDRPVELLLPAVADWRWGLSGELTPWYPHMRITRQRAGEAWPQVLARAAEGLVRRLREPAPVVGANPQPPKPAASEALPMRDTSRSMDQNTSRTREAEAIGPLWRQVTSTPANAAAWLDLATHYDRADLPWQSAYAARQAVRLDASLAPRVQSLRHAGRSSESGDALLGRAALPEAAALQERFQAWVAGCPGDWLTWLYLARLADLLPAPGAPTDTAGAAPERPVDPALTQASALEPIPGEALHWLGVWRLNAGDAAGAINAFSGLLNLRPMRFGSMMYLGEALVRQGNLVAAEKAFTRASQSTNPEFLSTLAARVYAHNYWQEAIGILQKALSVRPGSVPHLLALAKIQSEVYSLADCRETLRQLQAVDPANAEARLLQAGLQGRMGDARNHLAMLQQAYESGGDPLSRLASSVAMTALYHDELSPQAVADLHRRLCAPIEAASPARTRFDNAKDPARRLKIGFLTGDLHRQHPVNIFMLPVLLRFDHGPFDIAIYHTGTMHDEYTRRAQACADRWVEAAALDDVALQKQIIDDGVDVLVDLAGHTSTHRLGVLALRAAPVQATFLGYPHSTGLSTIDWLIGDATVSPSEHASLFSEGIAQLPGTVFCWAPVDEYPLPAPRPAAAPPVFGSFNNAMKLSPRTLRLWARVLKAVPGSQLLLKAPSLRDEAVQARFAGLLEAEGIARSRLIMQGPTGLADMMQAYGEMDIALDPTPYNGGTTTQQALWMGVPVVALTGGNFVSRMGASFMHTLGHPEWVADDEDAYVACAVRLAGQLPALRQGRAALRAQMAASPLCDIDAYVRHFETLLRRMWQAHCTGENRRLLAA